LTYGVVDVDVDIVQKIVILLPVSAPFALKTLELIINIRYVSKKGIRDDPVTRQKSFKFTFFNIQQ